MNISFLHFHSIDNSNVLFHINTIKIFLTEKSATYGYDVYEFEVIAAKLQ